MTSYKNFVIQAKQGSIMPAYTDLLIDINYCLNLFSDLEMERSYGERFSDYIGSERRTINFEELYLNLKNIKREMELGSSLLKKFFLKYNLLISLKRAYGEPPEAIEFVSDNNTGNNTKCNFPNSNFFEILESKFEEFIETVDAVEISEIPSNQTKVLGTGLSKVQVMTLLGAYAVGFMADVGIFHKNTENRIAKYDQAKRLYDSLNQNEILKLFKGNHKFIEGIVQNIDSAIENIGILYKYLRKEASPPAGTINMEFPMLQVCNFEEKK